MVNNAKNISAYNGELPEGDADRKISGGPLYSAAEVETALANGESSITVWTRKCKNDVQSLSLDADDLAELLRSAIDGGQFKGSEWCEQKPSGPWAACDAYRLNRLEWADYANKEIRFSYYVKFGLSRTGAIVLLASCHL